MPLQIHLSNRLEVIYEDLRNRLFKTHSDNPLVRRLIVVYGPSMQSWLSTRLADDLGISTGIEFVYLNQAFTRLLSLTRSTPLPHLATPIELALAIEIELHRVVNSKKLSPAEQHDWKPIFQYLKHNSTRRLIDLSERLAHVVYEYGRSKITIPQSGWQRRLWESLYNENSPWSFLTHELAGPIALQTPIELHFFSVSYLIKPEWSFLQRLSAQAATNYYLLSPCMHFWSDIRSDREAASLLSFWQGKVGDSSPQLSTLDDLLQDRNPLLANNGFLGREMARLLEESVPQVNAHYAIPSSLAEAEEAAADDNLSFFNSGTHPTALQAIQADILFMRNPEESARRAFVNEEESIQVHLAPNKRREVECLYHTLLGLIGKNSPHITPRDIVVMAPNMMEYIPYIQSVFGNSQSLLGFQILDLELSFNNEIAQGFLSLLALNDGRWEASHLLQLFAHPAFQRKQHLSKSDYEQIRDWIEAKGIKWGADVTHRNEILQRNHCINTMVETNGAGSWNHGFQQLLDDLATTPTINFSQCELLGKFIQLIHSLRDDLTPFHDQTLMTIDAWTSYLKSLLEVYLSPDRSSQKSVENYDALKELFDHLKAAGRHIPKEQFSFTTVKTHLMKLLQQRKGTYHENPLQAVRFCSMIPLRSIPSKVIAMLGMHEEAFPRHPDPVIRNLAGNDLASDFPSSLHEDRYLFLEALQSARDYLLIFYPAYDPKEGIERPPSLVVQEVVSYLDRYYTIENEKWSKRGVYRHPFESYHSSYFDEKSPIKSTSPFDYAVAQAFYNGKKDSHQFVKRFEKPHDLQTTAATTLDIKHLSSIARKPIKYYLNNGLGIYLESDEDRVIADEEQLVLSPLSRYQIKQDALYTPLETVLISAEREGKLPLGLFKQAAINKIKDEIEEIHECIRAFGVDVKSLFNIEFIQGCSMPQQVGDKLWHFPALPVGQCYLVGKLENVSAEGIIIPGKAGVSDIWKQWPAFLVLCKAEGLFPGIFRPQLIMTEAKAPIDAPKVDIDSFLKQWMGYHELCLQQFCPLMPEWLPYILDEDPKGLEKKWLSLFSDNENHYPSPECKWILHKDHLPSAVETIQEWKPYAVLLTPGQ